MARCPECKRHYCRECVTEHEHRLLCASCIASIEVDEVRERRPIPVRGLIQITAGVTMLWVAFYILGQSLLLIPSEYHDSRNTLLEQIEAMDARDQAEKDQESAEDGPVDEPDADPSPPGES